jgi:hypothetical protein
MPPTSERLTCNSFHPVGVSVFIRVVPWLISVFRMKMGRGTAYLTSEVEVICQRKEKIEAVL